MNINDTITKAAEMSYAEDLSHVVGRIDGEWRIAEMEDSGRIAEMEEPIITVHGSGIDDQDWPWLEERFPDVCAEMK